ncbi:hypothetical protein Tco_0150045 [Tanacetum coccineum]
MGCSILTTTFVHLGVKVGGAMFRIKSWDDVVAKVSSRLSKWKLKTLSIGTSSDVYGTSSTYGNRNSQPENNSHGLQMQRPSAARNASPRCFTDSTDSNYKDRAASSNEGPFVGQSGKGTSCVHNEAKFVTPMWSPLNIVTTQPLTLWESCNVLLSNVKSILWEHLLRSQLISKPRCNVIEESGYTICHVVCLGSSDLDAATRPLNAHGHLQFF